MACKSKKKKAKSGMIVRKTTTPKGKRVRVTKVSRKKK